MVNKDFFLALDAIEREKGIDKELIINALEKALASAYNKNYGEATGVMVKLSPEKHTIKIYAYKHIVEEVVDPDKEMSILEAREIKKSYKVGDVHMTEIIPKDFGRIAAQTAKQVVIQAIREAERSMTYDIYSEREGELIVGIVSRINEEDGSVYVEIGRHVEMGKNQEGVLMKADQNLRETYRIGDQINVYVKRVKKNEKAVQIFLSRTAPGLVRRLFERDIPEVREGIVEIKDIVRDTISKAQTFDPEKDPAPRTKMSVLSHDPDIDAVGACVGNRGMRVASIINELGGEKIDIIEYTEDTLDYIARALSPATVLFVFADESKKEAKIIVNDDKFSLAVGKGGQNARLAAKLTGWKIDVKSYTDALRAGLLDGHLDSVEDMAAEPMHVASAPQTIMSLEERMSFEQQLSDYTEMPFDKDEDENSVDGE